MNYQDMNEKLDEISADVRDIKTVLKGYNGYPGLCKEHEELANDYYKFKRTMLIIIGVLIGSGVLGGGIFSAMNLMG